MWARPTRSSLELTEILISIAWLITGSATSAKIKAMRPARLSKAAQIESASEPSRKNMKASSQIGGRTVSAWVIFAGCTGETVSDFQVTLSV